MIRLFLQNLKAEGWTQEAIAEKVGIGQGLISTYMKGADVKASTLLKFADAFHVSTDTVLGRTGVRKGTNNYKGEERRRKPNNHNSGMA